jgi:hypothetical protein
MTGQALTDLRSLSKTLFGSTYRLEMLAAIESLKDEWTRSNLMDALPGHGNHGALRRAPASVVAQELAVVRTLGLVVETIRDPVTGEIRYQTKPSEWRSALVQAFNP